ncbi:hypothetical protein CBM2586_A50264 [Cupriavidus phytorum]|uniref:Uncharacterized protein n=1 Tax=Cupriavidus taiwanensis TaxID=164546 RepID=A0A375C351_9BURK|nr:hypothetical protein CBM2586_A50264 [Cupriavidus taiwanensis]
MRNPQIFSLGQGRFRSTLLAPQHARMLGYLRFSGPPCEGPVLSETQQ